MKKRFLAAALALSFAVSAAPVLASSVLMTMDGKAVTAERPYSIPNYFSDAAQIKHWEAVGTLAIWGVIAGKDNGAFEPAAPVTRAEMAKLVCAMRYGGHDLREEPTVTFDDTVGHWAARYISDCAERGVIAGRGDNKFDPDATVTAAEAAKMLLVLLGYNAEVFGLNGEKWKERTISPAMGAKLFDGIEDLNVDAPLSRDDAGQMLYNTLYAHVMVGTEKVQENGEITTYYSLKYDETYENVGSFMIETFGTGLGGPPDQPKGDENI